MKSLAGTVSILNVAGGDVKISFDKENVAERIRAARIVKDMLRRGYALLIEVERDGEKRFERALEFREDSCEYVIADYDPNGSVEKERTEDTGDGESEAKELEQTETPKTRRGRKAVPASGTRAVAVGRSAGG